MLSLAILPVSHCIVSLPSYLIASRLVIPPINKPPILLNQPSLYNIYKTYRQLPTAMNHFELQIFSPLLSLILSTH